MSESRAHSDRISSPTRKGVNLSESGVPLDRFSNQMGEVVRKHPSFRQICKSKERICPKAAVLQTDLQVKGANLSESTRPSDRIANQRSESVRKHPSFRQICKSKERICLKAAVLQTELQVNGANLSESTHPSDRFASKWSESV
ncbi:hypothetical protein [Bacillus sp. B15-48]|uniref:hypothetical protein n=1 Tax=Bacillus sp. B15-48 TaxID=1548601 RepID=UPI00193F11DC|nr:hypothetical protein [Bacillus sp. B15-48]MBM4765341.1 hypothetical protein [Bacillus sp. B15-48]